MEPQTPREEPYPVQFDVAYPDRDLNRLSTGFRIFAAIPILILSALLTGPGSAHWGHNTATITFSSPSDPSTADTNAGFHYTFACDGLDGSLAATYVAAGAPVSTTCPFIDISW